MGWNAVTVQPTLLAIIHSIVMFIGQGVVPEQNTVQNY